MELDQYKVELDPVLGIILVEHPTKSVSVEKLLEIKKIIENSTKSRYNYGILRRSPGYYFSYILSPKEVIVCGRFNKKECVDETKEFVKNSR